MQTQAAKPWNLKKTLTIRRFLGNNYIRINVCMDYMTISTATYSSFNAHETMLLHWGSRRTLVSEKNVVKESKSKSGCSDFFFLFLEKLDLPSSAGKECGNRAVSLELHYFCSSSPNKYLHSVGTPTKHPTKMNHSVAIFQIGKNNLVDICTNP